MSTSHADLKKVAEDLQGERNANARAVPKAPPEQRPALIQKGKELGEALQALEAILRQKELA